MPERINDRLQSPRIRLSRSNFTKYYCSVTQHITRVNSSTTHGQPAQSDPLEHGAEVDARIRYRSARLLTGDRTHTKLVMFTFSESCFHRPMSF